MRDNNMSVSVIENEADAGMLQFGEDLLEGEVESVQPLTEDDKPEALAFLSRRPLYTICMTAYLRENGMISPYNRGTFYGYRNRAGCLEGVALIGHATLIETTRDAALKAFARLKQEYTTSNFIRGEQEMIGRFWNYYAQLGHEPRLVCRELLFEQTSVPEFPGESLELELATLDDLEEIMTINSQMIMTECGVSPVQKDPSGFRQRIARRIEKGQFWLLKKDGEMIFKADVFAEAPEMAYLEGVYVHPQARGKGLGLRCLSRLGQVLLSRTRATCLLISENRKQLASFYRQAGYEFRGYYDTIYLHQEAN
jgi:predicted GNAT family acetyltransferase